MVPFAQWTEQFLSLFLIHSGKLSPVTGGEQWTVENGERGFFPRNSFQQYHVMGRLVSLTLFLIMTPKFSQICKSSVTRDIYRAEFSNSPYRCCVMFFKCCLFVTSIIQLSSVQPARYYARIFFHRVYTSRATLQSSKHRLNFLWTSFSYLYILAAVHATIRSYKAIHCVSLDVLSAKILGSSERTGLRIESRNSGYRNKSLRNDCEQEYAYTYNVE